MIDCRCGLIIKKIIIKTHTHTLRVLGATLGAIIFYLSMVKANEMRENYFFTLFNCHYQIIEWS
jgi:hypothetical protein